MSIIKCALQAGGIGIWKCWFLWREENRTTRRKTLKARTRTNNKLNPHLTPGPGIEPGPLWWKASALTTAPSLLPQYALRPIRYLTQGSI